MEFTPEQIRSQEIEALTGMPGWGYLVEDFQRYIEETDSLIFDIDVPDTLEYSLRSILIARRNCLKAMIEKPQSLLGELKSIK